MKDKDTLSGRGPWTFNSPSLAAGESWRIDFNTYEKGKYRKYAPMDEMLVKNYDADNRVVVHVNEVFEVDIDPNGKDSYDEAGIRKFRVENVGSTTIEADDVTVTIKKAAFDADEAARLDAARGPLTSIVKNKLGL